LSQKIELFIYMWLDVQTTVS